MINASSVQNITSLKDKKLLSELEDDVGCLQAAINETGF
jgi:hypothetical protein